MFAWLLQRLRGDKVIWLIVILLSCVSLLAVYSSSSALAVRMQGGDTEYYVLRHALLLIVGFIVIFVVHLLDYRLLAKVTNGLLYLTIPLLVYTLFKGTQLNEASRWINVFGQSFQPSDLAKLTIMIYLARLLTQRQKVIQDFWEGFAPAIFWIGVICGLIAPQNLSTASVIFIASMMVVFIAGVEMKYLFYLVGVGLLGLVLLFSLASRAKTWNSRIEAYQQQLFAGDEYKGNYQALQGNIAVASGGILGKGAGKSMMRNFLPLAFSDFVYAIIVEEYGLIGGLIVLLLYLGLLFRTVLIVTSSKTYGGLLAAGLCIILVLQALINMGVTTGLLPVTGLTLPLISMGGTSIIFTSVSIGIILSVSRDAMGTMRKAQAVS